MKDGKTNQHGAPCRLCGAWVKAGEGVLERTQLPDGTYGWVVEHQACPVVPEGVTAVEVARWAVHCKGLTALGNRAAGVRFVDGESPNHDAIPMNDTARRMAADWPAQPRRPHDEHVAEILARYGHTPESFDELGVLRAAWVGHVHWSERVAQPSPAAADLREALTRHGVTDEQIAATRAKRMEGET